MVLTTADVQAVNFENIPSEMKSLDMWVIWKAVETDRGFTKVPYQTDGMNKASSTDKRTWATFQEVKEAYENGIGNGVGIILSNDNHIYTLDIDGTTEHKLLDDMKQKTYCELSPSGNGVHVYMIGDKPKEFKKKVIHEGTELELYATGRFMTVTGHQISEGNSLIEGNETLDYLISTIFKPNESNSPSTPQIEGLGVSKISKDEVIALVTNHHSYGEDMKLILTAQHEQAKDRNGQHYAGRSEAEQGLMNTLAFYTNGDKDMLWDLYRTTPMYRQDKDHQTGGMGLTIRNAISSLTGTYDPNYSNEYGLEAGKLSGKELVDEIKRLRAKELERMEAEWEENNKVGRKPSIIQPPRCATILQSIIKFAMFDIDEGTQLAMYQADEGIYTQKPTLIKRIIGILEPKLTEQRARDVIYHLSNQTDIVEKTVSKYLIPTKNGIFNRQTWSLEPFTPDYVFTTKTDTNYVDNAPKPVIDGWDVDDWLKEIANNDNEIVNVLWQVMNESLNGNYTRGKAIFLIGEGLNGKGTFQELIANLIGYKNVAGLKINEFDERFKLSVLEGKTVCIGDDVPAHVYVDDSSNFNSVVTGDMVSVEMKNKPVYTTHFRTTVIQSTNGLPRFKNKSNGTLRRFLIVPFNAQFTTVSDNRKIKEEYIKDPRVLEYILHKAINMDFENFDIPKASLEALEEFKQDNDPIYEFKTNVFDIWESDVMPKSLVYEVYQTFCEENGYKAMSSRKFHTSFKTHLVKDKGWTTDSIARVSPLEIISKLEIDEGYLHEVINTQTNEVKPCKVYKFETKGDK